MSVVNVVSREIQADDAEQQGERADEGVDEELEGRRARVFVPPDRDDEVHPTRVRSQKM
jgi:hypothetical protein